MILQDVNSAVLQLSSNKGTLICLFVIQSDALITYGIVGILGTPPPVPDPPPPDPPDPPDPLDVNPEPPPESPTPVVALE